MITVCPTSFGLENDERFQRVKSAYRDRKFSDYELMMKLQAFREKNDLDIDWWPITEDDFKAFTNYLDTPTEKSTSAPVTKESLNDLYQTLNTAFTPTELRNRLNRITELYSQYVTNLLNNSSLGVTRQQAIQSQATKDKNGFNVILEKVFEYIKQMSTLDGQIAWYAKANRVNPEDVSDKTKAPLEERAKKFAKMYEHKESLATLAALQIGAKEGFAVNVDGLQYEFRDLEELESLEDDDNSEEEVDAGEAQKGDRYVDYRTFSLMSTLSTDAKLLLDKIKVLDRNGKPVRDDLGYPVKVNPKQSAVALHKILRTSTPSSMMDDLKRARSRYPWMGGLVSYLEANPDEQTLVYCNFKKARSSYYYGYVDKNGRIAVRQINNIADGRGLSREAGINLSDGLSSENGLSIVDTAGNLAGMSRISEIKNAISELSKYSKNQLQAKPVSEREARWATKNAADDWRNAVNEKPDSDFEGLTNILRGFGFSLDVADVKYALANASPIAQITGTKNGLTPQLSSLDRLIGEFNAINDKAEYILKSGDDLTGSHLYNYAQSEFKNIADILSVLQRDEVEERSISRNKSLAASVTPNAIHELADKLANVAGLSDAEYKQMLIDEFGQFEGMSLGYGDNLTLTGWLADLYNDGRDGSDASFKKIRSSFQVIDFTDLNIGGQQKEFAKLSSVEHLLNSYVMYMRGAANRASEFSGHLYEVPIQADYETAYNFIVAPSYKYEELVERLAQEVECEAQRIIAIQERQANDPKSGDPIRAIDKVYEKRGLQFQIFPALNTQEFFDAYANASTGDAHAVVKRAVDEQLQIMLGGERRKLKEKGFFGKENQKLAGYKNEKDATIDDWLLNAFYARQQFTKLMFGGLEQFKSTSDFEKRNMYSHATRLPMNTNAMYRGQKVGKENQRVLYLSDDEAKSAFIGQISKIADKLLAQGKISSSQCEQMKAAYASITTTDGQGFRTLDSMRDVKIMASIWQDSDEVAYQRIKSGNYTPADVQHFMVGIKPVYTGYEIIEAQPGEHQKRIRVPVLHKYSETVLLPEMLEAVGAQNATSPLKAMNKINNFLGKNDKIDLFLFGSGVKVGAHSVIDAFAKDDDGNRILRSSDSIANFVSDKLKSANFWIHNLPYKYYGITSSMHANIVDERIASATQAEKETWGNIMPDETLVVAGKTMKSTDARDLFYQIKAARTIDTFKKLNNRLYDKREVAKILKEELAGKPYQSRDLVFALQMRDNGKIAYPLYSPNIQHDATALLASIVKKQFTKVPTKGANMTQTTSFGMDAEYGMEAFEETMAAAGFEPLEVVFDKNGNFQYVEVYTPVYDSRLERFADKNGNITPERLRKLIKDGYIPESILNFIAYRTPSDAEHSIIPCHIKGFMSNAAGASIRMPREIMKMTGHDYDGDKMRCHFKEFTLGWNYDQMAKDFRKYSDAEAVKEILSDGEVTLTPYEVFKRGIVSGQNPQSESYRALKEIKYDYEKSPLENIGDFGYDKLNNALVDLMFAQLTSVSGGLKMFIPGGAEETKQYANTIGTRESAASNVSPFTISHAMESHDYMMDGAGMIGVYALFNSAASMFQRMNLHYIQRTDKNGETIPVKLFGKTIDKLFPVTTKIDEENSSYTTLAMARLLNAAVDNGKDPLLGYLNQTMELAPMTNFLLAAGLSEEELHLIFNQPIIKELASRLKVEGSDKFRDVSNAILNEVLNVLPKDDRGKSVYYRNDNIQKVGMMDKARFERGLNKTYQDIVSGESRGATEDQVYVLHTFQYLWSAASDLEEITKLTRPESDAGGIDSSLGGIISKLIQLDKFRERLARGEVNISGAGDVLAFRDIYENSMTPEMIQDKIGNELPEVVALNSLMKDSILHVFREYFPQARESWLKLQRRIADQYSYKRLPKSVMDRISSDMILWKLLSDQNFITGNPQEEQERIIKTVPTELRALKRRIDAAKSSPESDKAAAALIDNMFLNNLDLGTTLNSENETISRIRFRLNGSTLDDTADTIRADWNAMLASTDEKISQLAKDLFKYNLYTNGFSYGRYEFAHFAPVSVVLSTPGYLNSLNSILDSNWSADDEENFFHQYIMNHWGDKNLIPRFSKTDFDNLLATDRRGDFLRGSQYVLIGNSDKGSYSDKLYRVEVDPILGITSAPVEAPKLGIRNKNGQVIVQYNPRVRDFREVKPVFASNKVAWEGRRAAEQNVDDGEDMRETARQNAIDDQPYEFPIPIPTTPKHIEQLQEETGKGAKINPNIKLSDSGVLTAEQAAALGFEDAFGDEMPSEKKEWARYSDNGYELSSAGDSRFSALSARFAYGTTIFGHDVSDRTIESIYQHGVKQNDWITDNNSKTGAPKSNEIIKGNTEDDSYRNGYLPLWQEWARQNPGLIDELKNLSEGKTLTDKFAASRVSQARALADILNGAATQSSNKEFYLVNRDENGNIVTGYFPATVENVERARIQQAFHDLNEQLIKLLGNIHTSDGRVAIADPKRVVFDAEARIIGGMTDFSTLDQLKSPEILAKGIIDIIQLSKGIEGEYALPEEFAHVAIEALGAHHAIVDENGNVIRYEAENKIVERLLNALNKDNSAMNEAFGGMLEAYEGRPEYQDGKGNINRDKLIVEAAGKLVSKQLFMHQYIKSPVKRLVQRVCEAIKNLFKNGNIREFWNAIFGANRVASQLAKDLLSGRLADQMSLDKITTNEVFLNINKDLSGKQDLLSKIRKRTKSLEDVLERRLKYSLTKNASSRSLDAVRAQLAKLQKDEQNQKLETTIADYLKDTMSFMSEMEKDLDAAINNRPANAVCKKLRIVKDTMYNFAAVTKDVREALATGEIKDDVNLKQTLRDISDEVERFWAKYNNISMMYFEQFLSNVYGKDGVTVKIGRQKGRRITIEEMARRADRDISMAARLLNAVSDCNDYVLQAIDDVTRDAKFKARERVMELRPRLEAAMEALIKEQGNRDQSWMFERKGGKRIGRYISKAQADRLSPAKSAFYDVFMELKREADACMPDSMVGERKIIMFRKQHYEKWREAQGLKGKTQDIWESAKRSLLEDGDIDFENEVVIKDFEGNIVDQLPVKFLNKGKNETFDDMTEDAATSLMAYLGMAEEYREMNNVVGLLENARYMSSRREVVQHRGLKNLITRVGDENDFHYQEPFTVKQAKTNIQAAMNDFFQMHVYGHLQKDEGTIGKTRISTRKAVNSLVGYTSLMQMAFNLHQRIANVNTGLTQIVVETAGKEIKAKDVTWAASVWVKESADRLAETGKTDYSNKLSLWMDHFDIHQDNGRDVNTTKYGKSNASRAFNTHLPYAGLTIGEDYLAGTTALAYARNYKMKGPKGEDSNLWDAFEVKFVDSKNKAGAYLELKPGYTKADGSEFTKEDRRKFMKKVIATNFELQGIYNVDDRSAIQQHSLGALAIMYRKWIAPAMKRRYAGVQYSKLKDDYTEGYYRTAVRMIGDTVKDWFAPVSEEESQKTIANILFDFGAMKNAIMLNWDKMTDYERGNVKKALREFSIVLGLLVASSLLTKLPPDDHNGNKFLNWADDMAITQLLRLRSEIGSQAPTPQMGQEALRILSSPFAALRPVTDGIQALAGVLWIPNYFDTVESGKYAGRTKAHKYFMKLPVISLFRKFDNFVDPSDMINYYKNMNY